MMMLFRNNPRGLTFAGLFVGYMGYYLCRQNLSVAAAPMQAAFGGSDAEFGLMFGWLSSIGTLGYAIGKITTGAIADGRWGGRRLFFLGLFGSALASLVFGVGQSMGFFVVIWTLNRLFQSMGWGGLVNVLARWYPPHAYGTAVGGMTLSFQLGGVFASLYAGWLLSLGGSWQSLFYIPALTLGIFGLVLLRFVQLPKVEAPGVHTSLQGENTVSISYLHRFKSLLRQPSFLMVALLSLLLTFLRECFNIWMPLYFSQMGSSHSGAAFKSAIFPLLGCVGALGGGWISDQIVKRRGRNATSRDLVLARLPLLIGFLMGLVVALILLAQVDRLAAWWGFAPLTLSVVLVGLVGFFLLGAYSFVGGVLALDFGGKSVAGTAAGLLDGAGYLGAALSGVGVAKLAFSQGWSVTYLFLAGVGGVALLLCLALASKLSRS